MRNAERAFSDFGWDEDKRLKNIEKHGIDFPMAANALMQPHAEKRSDQNGEVRILAICPLTNRMIAIIYTMRGDVCRIISAHAARKMSDKNIVSYSLDEIREKIAKGGDRTDRARVDAMTDEDIEHAMRDDPDWAGLIDFDWSGAQMAFPVQKKSISIRLDEDVIDFFKKSGKGYQTRINAVLRHYMKESASKR